MDELGSNAAPVWLQATAISLSVLFIFSSLSILIAFLYQCFRSNSGRNSISKNISSSHYLTSFKIFNVGLTSKTGDLRNGMDKDYGYDNLNSRPNLNSSFNHNIIPNMGVKLLNQNAPLHIQTSKTNLFMVTPSNNQWEGHSKNMNNNNNDKNVNAINNNGNNRKGKGKGSPSDSPLLNRREPSTTSGSPSSSTQSPIALQKPILKNRGSLDSAGSGNFYMDIYISNVFVITLQ